MGGGGAADRPDGDGHPDVSVYTNSASLLLLCVFFFVKAVVRLPC